MTAACIPASVKSVLAPTRIDAAAYAPKVAGGASRARTMKLIREMACDASNPRVVRVPPRTSLRRRPAAPTSRLSAGSPEPGAGEEPASGGERSIVSVEAGRSSSLRDLARDYVNSGLALGFLRVLLARPRVIHGSAVMIGKNLAS